MKQCRKNNVLVKQCIPIMRQYINLIECSCVNLIFSLVAFNREKIEIKISLIIA
jgi:hypothetical protein